METQSPISKSEAGNRPECNATGRDVANSYLVYDLKCNLNTSTTHQYKRPIVICIGSPQIPEL